MSSASPNLLNGTFKGTSEVVNRHEDLCLPHNFVVHFLVRPEGLGEVRLTAGGSNLSISGRGDG
eukprot:763219-Hanusia_phi.AAC.4